MSVNSPSGLDNGGSGGGSYNYTDPPGGMQGGGSPRRYNTTPTWQDPFNPPSPGDPYWNDWFAANPGYQVPSSGQWPGYSGPGSSGDGGTGGGGWQWGDDQIQALLKALNGGQSGEGFISQYDQHFGLQPGGSLAYYQGTNTYALPGGYAAIGPDGHTWGWNPRGPEGGGNSSGPTTYTWDQALQRASQAAGHTLSEDEIQALLKQFGGTEGENGITQAGLDPVLAYLRQRNGGAGGPGPGNLGNDNFMQPVDGGIGPGGGDPRATELYNYLMQRAHQSEQISPDDPIIKGQTESYAAEQTRGARDLLSSLAEKGGANANPDAATRSAAEKAGQNTADYQGQLMSRELQARRDEIQQALNGAQGLLTSEQQMALTEELHKLDLMENESQFWRMLQERAFEFGATNNP